MANMALVSNVWSNQITTEEVFFDLDSSAFSDTADVVVLTLSISTRYGARPVIKTVRLNQRDLERIRA